MILLFIALFLCVNIYITKTGDTDTDNSCRISINRMEHAIKEYEEAYDEAPSDLTGLLAYVGVDGYEGITGLAAAEDKEGLSRLVDASDDAYEIFVTDRYIYKISYENVKNNHNRIIVNLVMIVSFAIVIFILIYIRKRILMPFHRMERLTYELAKGNLTIPLDEEKNRYFGKYLWGMNMLRESIEEGKARELALHKEKKLLLLSLSHDIKTPLSTIKLYAKALSRKLYKDEEKKIQLAEQIDGKADEIEKYVSDIVSASREDFLHFEVENVEMYIKDVLSYIDAYYTDKMKLTMIDFEVKKYNNVLVWADKERLIEVIQNVVENAIKYGDGKRIWIECESSDEEFIINIMNSGEIISDKEMSMMFESFFRGSNVGKQPGSGLGLYICRQLVHLMEGEVMAENREGYMNIRIVLKRV